MNLKRASNMAMKGADNDHQKNPERSGEKQKPQRGDNNVDKDKIRAFVKRKLKPIHQEIIAPPGQ